jgi:hypothetical protein
MAQYRGVLTDMMGGNRPEDSSVIAMAILVNHHRRHQGTYTSAATKATMAALMLDWLAFYDAGETWIQSVHACTCIAASNAVPSAWISK